MNKQILSLFALSLVMVQITCPMDDSKGKEPDYTASASSSSSQSEEENTERGPTSSFSEPALVSEKDLDAFDPDAQREKRFLQREARRYIKTEKKLSPKLRAIVMEHAPQKVAHVIREINDPTRKTMLGFIFYGPTGSSKSTLAQAIAEKLGYECKFIKATVIGATLKHNSEVNISHVIKEACAQEGKTVVVIDEIDTLIPNNAHGDDRDSEGIKALSQVLDEFANHKDLIVIGTTNYIDRLPATSPGRFKFLIEVPEADTKYRKAIIKFCFEEAGNVIHSECLTDSYFGFLNTLAKETKGLTIRDILNIVSEAKAAAFDRHELEQVIPAWYSIRGNLSRLAKAIRIKKNDDNVIIRKQDVLAGLTAIKNRPDVQKRTKEKCEKALWYKCAAGLGRNWKWGVGVGISVTGLYYTRKWHNESIAQQKTSHKEQMDQTKNDAWWNRVIATGGIGVGGVCSIAAVVGKVLKRKDEITILIKPIGKAITTLLRI